MSFAAQFAAGSRIADDLINTYRDSKQRRELNDIAEARPEQSIGFTADQGEALRAAADAGATITYDDASKAYVVTPAGGGAARTVAQQGVTDFLGDRRAGSMTPGQVNAARMAAGAGVFERNGDPATGVRMRAAADGMQAAERDQADNQAQRNALAGQTTGALPVRNAALRSDIGTGGDIIGASNVPEVKPAGYGATAATAATAGVTLQPQGAPQPAAPTFDSYLKSVAPNVLKTLVTQGKLDQAKQFQQFVESNDGKAYTSAWVNGVRRLSMGDTKGAMGVFETMYNAQLFDDGHTVKLAPVEGKPDQYSVEMLDPQGKSLGSKIAPIADLAKTAALYLSPDRAVEFMATQQGKREAEDAALNKTLELERARQTGREFSEDRRDGRLVMQLQAQQTGLEKRLAARQSGGDRPLTAAQQRGNFEIDAAREIVQGLTPAEIRKRTAKTTDTGRENADYDPGLARAATLAARRKLGEDQAFDQRAPAQQAAPAVDRTDVAKRFRADKAMNAHKLGKDTPNGTEVLDSSGKLLGYYR